MFNSYLEILRNVSRNSVLGPILSNLFINDLMFFIQEIEVSNFADDKTIYSCSPSFEEATLKLSNDTHFILNWFRINSMVENLENLRLCFLCQTLTIAKLHL